MTLIDILSKLDGPDREVDGIIAETFGYPQEVFGSSFGTAYVDGPDMHYDEATWSGEGKSWSAPYFTASVDAAIALAERVLPGRVCDIVSTAMCIIITTGKDVSRLAREIVIALLRAKEASHGE
ncbi:hypothetical protein ABE527_14375 [Brucella sp. TWI432]